MVAMACTSLRLPIPSNICSRSSLASIRFYPTQLRVLHQHCSVSVYYSGLEKQAVGVHGVRGVLTQKPVLKAILNSDRGSEASSSEDGKDLPPPGCSRIKVELTKPLGIALEEDKFGNIFIAEVIRDGNADKTGLVDVGDQLIATSAVVYGSEDDYQGVMVRKGMQIVRLNVRGEKFNTVMAAIGTHPAYIKVKLELQKCKPLSTDSSSNGSVRE
ncbi:unnamed protein product [Sphagnum compactum]